MVSPRSGSSDQYGSVVNIPVLGNMICSAGVCTDRNNGDTGLPSDAYFTVSVGRAVFFLFAQSLVWLALPEEAVKLWIISRTTTHNPREAKVRVARPELSQEGWLLPGC